MQRRIANSSESEKQTLLRLVDELNLKIHNTIYSEGKMCIHTFKLPDLDNRCGFKDSTARQVLGVIFGNPRTSLTDVERIVATVDEIGGKLYKELMGLLLV